jgi:hypothetical protein
MLPKHAIFDAITKRIFRFTLSELCALNQAHELVQHTNLIFLARRDHYSKTTAHEFGQLQLDITLQHISHQGRQFPEGQVVS